MRSCESSKASKSLLKAIILTMSFIALPYFFVTYQDQNDVPTMKELALNEMLAENYLSDMNFKSKQENKKLTIVITFSEDMAQSLLQQVANLIWEVQHAGYSDQVEYRLCGSENHVDFEFLSNIFYTAPINDT